MAITHHSSKPPITQGWLLIAMTACVIAILSINAFLLMREHRSVELAAIRTSLNIMFKTPLSNTTPHSAR